MLFREKERKKLYRKCVCVSLESDDVWCEEEKIERKQERSGEEN